MFLRPVRTSQPQGPSRIDWSNPITRGLVFAWLPGRFNLNLVDGSAPTSTGLSGAPLTKPTQNGIGGFNTVSRGLFYTPKLNPSESYSAVLCFVPSSNRVSDVVFECGSAANTVFTLYGDSYGYLNTQAGLVAEFFTADPGIGVYTVLCLVVSAGRAKLYNNRGSVYEVSYAGASRVIGSLPAHRICVLDSATGGGASIGPNLLSCLSFKAFTDSEALSVVQNPWQIFAPDSKALWIPAAASVSLPTLVQPNATTSAGAWTATGAASLHAAINELVPSDTQYISVNSASTTELLLAESAYPGTSSQTLAYRASSTQGSTLTVTLKQGATQIMTRTHALTATDTLYTQTLTSGEIALITAGPISVTLTTS